MVHGVSTDKLLNHEKQHQEESSPFLENLSEMAERIIASGATLSVVVSPRQEKDAGPEPAVVDVTPE